MQQENEGGRKSGPDVNAKFRVEMTNSYDAAALTAKIDGLNCIRGESIAQTTDAHISAYEEGKPFTIVPEVYGNNVEIGRAHV